MKRKSLVSPISAALALAGAGLVFGQGVQIEKAPAPGAELHNAAPSKAAEHKPTPVPTPTAAEALYDYLQKYHIQVAKDQSGSRLIWTDRALIEIADDSPPEPLAGLLATAPPNNGRFASWVHDAFETQLKSWQPGKRNPKPAKQGTDELVADTGGVRCYINPVYVAYVLSRYPTANILVKSPKDPALFTVNGQLRAVVSPWTQLPDGTPLL